MSNRKSRYMIMAFVMLTAVMITKVILFPFKINQQTNSTCVYWVYVVEMKEYYEEVNLYKHHNEKTKVTLPL